MSPRHWLRVFREIMTADHLKVSLVINPQQRIAMRIFFAWNIIVRINVWLSEQQKVFILMGQVDASCMPMSTSKSSLTISLQLHLGIKNFFVVFCLFTLFCSFGLRSFSPPPPSSFSSKLETQNRMKTLLKEFLNFCFCFALFVQNRRINFRVGGFFCKFLERNAVVVKMVA